jgi:hypothetical protein
MCEDVMCSVKIVLLNVRGKVPEVQTLLDYNTWSCITSSHCLIISKYYVYQLCKVNAFYLFA